MKRKRTVVHVVYDAETKLWTAKVGGMVIGLLLRRSEAVDFYRDGMRKMSELGYAGQLVVHRKDGKIEYENTYLRDPKGKRG